MQHHARGVLLIRRLTLTRPEHLDHESAHVYDVSPRHLAHRASVRDVVCDRVEFVAVIPLGDENSRHPYERPDLLGTTGVVVMCVGEGDRIETTESEPSTRCAYRPRIGAGVDQKGM